MNILLLITLLIAFGLSFMGIRAFQLPMKIRKAEEAMDLGEFPRASEIIKQILERKKDYVPARYIRAQLLMRQKQYLMAISELNNILTISSFNKHVNELDIHYHLAQLYNETQNYQKEIEEYKLILTFNPDDIKANHRIGHAHYQQGSYKLAREHLQKAYQLNPKLIDTLLPLGVSCYYSSDYKKAEEYLTLSLEIPGEHIEAEFYLGSIYKLSKSFDESIRMFEKSKQSPAYFLMSLYNLGEIYFEQDDYSKAIEVLEPGLNRINDSTEEGQAYRYLLAECYELENKIKEAVHHWEKISENNPNYRSTRLKIDAYKEVITNKSLMGLFATSLENLQPLIVEIISSLNYNIVSKERVTSNEYQYRAFNIKRINDPQVLIYFNRTTREISEGQIQDFYKRVTEEKCKSGIYIATSRFSIRAKSAAATKMIELYDSDYVVKSLAKIQSRKKNY